MKHLVLSIACACAFAACSATEDRPETLAYITETILAPFCATAECHSAMKDQSGYAFDSVELAQDAIAGETGTAGMLIASCSAVPCDASDNNNYLLKVIDEQDIYGNRMPLDQPLANKDIVLIHDWIANGAVGYTPPAN
jgi:hypothetical protein